MCGLVGMVGDLQKKHEDMMTYLIQVDSLRGFHSTGVAFVKPDGNTDIIKVLGSGYEMTKNDRYKVNLLSKNAAIIGHNRYATIGAVNVENAHPFQYGSIIGAHNGTLINKYIIEENGEKFDVDSQALVNSVDKRGLDKTLQYLNGAWALTMWDSNDNAVKIVRNEERPLFVAYTDDAKVLCWASEDWMLHQAAWRAGVKLDKVLTVAKDTLYTIPVDKNTLGAVSRRECRSFWKPPENNGYWGNSEGWSKSYRKELPAPSKEKQIPKATGNVVRIDRNKTHDLLGSHSIEGNVVGHGVESTGSRYLLIVADNYENDYIRLYIHAKDKTEDYIGERVIFDLHDKMYLNTGTNVPYLKALYSTHLIVEQAAKILDHNGNEITKETFEKTYGTTCNWCSASIEPEEGKYFINASKALLCQDCEHDQEVRVYVH